LSDDLLCIGLDSPTILKGVILLIFEKALDEPKYSSMYAQLCRRLSEEAPNFEPSQQQNGSAVPSISTFRQLLLAKCRVEFENRSAAQEAFDSRDGSLTADEEEQRQAAKRKMLGNIKFIGELGKLGMLQGAILHMCIQQLLERKRRGGIREMAEDLECLCQIMRTCGRILDIEKAKSLMNQYFNRMAAYAVNAHLPSRIRFMLQDSIDLRSNHWQPRKIASADGPRTIQQIREEAARDIGVYLPPPGSQHHHHAHHGHHMRGAAGAAGAHSAYHQPGSGLFPISRSFKGPTGIGLDDVFGSLPLGAVSIGTGPGVIPSMQDGFGYDSDPTHNGGHSNNSNLYRGRQSYSGGGGGSGNSGGGAAGGGGGGGGGNYSNRGPSNGINNYTNNSSSSSSNNKQFSSSQQQPLMHQNMNMNLANNAKNDLPPRFKRMMMTQQKSQGSSSEEVSLRPSANSMVNKPKASGVLPKINGNGNGTGGPLGALVDAALPTGSSSCALAPPSSPPSAATVLGDRQKSVSQRKEEKGPTKEEVLKQVELLVDELLVHQTPETCCTSLKELAIPSTLWSSVVASLMRKVLDQSDQDRELLSVTLTLLNKEQLLTPALFLEGFKELVQQLPDVEKDLPRAKSLLAGLVARAVTDQLATLSDLASPLEGGHQYPLFLLTLQQLHKNQQDKSALTKLFNDSKVQLMMMLPELDRTKERLAEILDDRGLGFLFPLLRIQSDLWKQIEADSSPTQFYKWIKENLDPVCYTVPAFISALFTVLLKYIAQEASDAQDLPSTDSLIDRANQEKEKELIERYRPVLQAFLHDQLDLQVTVLHALQNFCCALGFPKGMLLRWFVVLYDLEIVEEEAFLRWKEDLSDDTPGKGKALFQVNNWLMWLEQAESDEDEDGDA